MTVADDILDEMTPGEPYTAGELADKLDSPRRTVDHHLRELEEGGDVRRKKHSARRVTWWVPIAD